MMSFSQFKGIEVPKTIPILVTLVLGLGVGVLAGKAMPGPGTTMEKPSVKVPLHVCEALPRERVHSVRDQLLQLEKELDFVRSMHPASFFNFDGFDTGWSDLIHEDWGDCNQHNFGFSSFEASAKDDGKTVEIRATVPGLSEKDLDVTISSDAVSIRGTISDDVVVNDDRGQKHQRSCRSFSRTIPLPSRVQADKAEATLSKGILVIRAPKNESPAETPRKLSVRSL